MLWNVNVPNTGREKPVTFPTALGTAVHLREATAASMTLRPVHARRAGKVRLLLNREVPLDTFDGLGLTCPSPPPHSPQEFTQTRLIRLEDKE